MPGILFICHGNICRSPMAEMILKQLVRERGLEERFVIGSAAVSREELGNPVYPPARRELARHGIPCGDHRARQVRPEEYNDWDFFPVMDRSNIMLLGRIFPSDPAGKVRRLLSWAGQDRDVSDPWYTDRFDVAYEDIRLGCEALLDSLTGRSDLK